MLRRPSVQVRGQTVINVVYSHPRRYPTFPPDAFSFVPFFTLNWVTVA